MKSPFLIHFKEFMISRHYARKTVNTYAYWIRQYVLFHDKRHPSELDNHDAEAFLTHLVVKLNVASSTQSIALNA